MAHLSGDPAFIEAFHQGGDIHRQTAALIFGVAVGAGDVRDAGPGQDHQLRHDLRAGPVRAEPAAGHLPGGCEGLHRALFRALRRRARLSRPRRSQLAREQGYVETLFKRRRYIPEIKDRNFNMRALRRAERAELTAAGLRRRPDQARDGPHPRRHRASGELQSRMLLQVHDELVFEVPPGEIEADEHAGPGPHGAGGRSCGCRWWWTSGSGPTGWTPSDRAAMTAALRLQRPRRGRPRVRRRRGGARRASRRRWCSQPRRSSTPRARAGSRSGFTPRSAPAWEARLRYRPTRHRAWPPRAAVDHCARARPAGA